MAIIYIDYILLGITKKEYVAMMRENMQIPDRQFSRLFTFWFTPIPDSLLKQK